MYSSDAYVDWFLETSAYISDRLKLWFERDRQLHAIELQQLFGMLHWKFDHTLDLHASWQLIIDAEKSNGKIPPIVEFALSSDKLIAARTAHEVAAQVAMSASTRIWTQFEFDWIKTVEGLDLPGWVSAHVAEVNAWHLDVTSDLPTDGSQKELLARMRRERLVVEAWRDRMELLDSPSYPAAQSNHGMVATEQKTLASLEQRILTLLDNQASSTDAQQEAVDEGGLKQSHPSLLPRESESEPLGPESISADGDVTDRSQPIFTELQRKILDVLDGTAMTGGKLMAALDIGSKDTLHGRKKGGVSAGGLNELMELKVVKNRRSIGGYFRPDRPPKPKD